MKEEEKQIVEFTKEDDAYFEFQAWFLLQENWRRNKNDVIFLFIKITFSLLHIKATT